MIKYFDTVFLTTSIPAVGALVYVLDGSGNRAPLFSDSAGTIPLANPVTTDRTGFFSFYVADGTYTLQYVLSGTVLRTITDVQLYTLADFAAPTGSSLIGFKQAGSTTVRNVQSKLYDYAITPQDFGAKADGVTDDTAAINLALAEINKTGGTVFFPNGVYLCNGQWNMAGFSNVHVRGEGGCFQGGNQVGTMIKFTRADSTSCINNTNGVGCSFHDIVFTYTSSTYSGTVLDASCSIPANVTQGLIENCQFTQLDTTNSAQNLVALNNVSGYTIDNCVFSRANCAIRGGNNGAAGASNAVTVSNCVISFCNAAIANPNNFWTILRTSFEPSPTLAPTQIFNDVSNQLTNLTIIGCFFGDVLNTGTHLNFIAATDLLIEGNIFGGDNVHTTTALALAGSSVGVNVIGNTFTGLTVGIGVTGTVNSGQFTGNTFASTGTPVFGKSSITNAFFAGNFGLVTQNQGVATLLAGQTGVTVNHGLGLTPGNGQIAIVPGGDTLGARWWLQSWTATQFVININATQASNIVFYWNADVDQ